MVTCELSRVCWLKRRQHNMQHMQVTRRGEKLVKSRKTEPAPPFVDPNLGGQRVRRSAAGLPRGGGGVGGYPNVHTSK